MYSLSSLREKHPTFSYDSYSWEIDDAQLHIQFQFTLYPDIVFKPTVVIHDIDTERVEKIDRATLDNLVFHLGLIEIPSYWKSACSPQIIIKSGFLKTEQLQWWKDLLIKGLGEFFYQNTIDFTPEGFVSFASKSNKKHDFLYKKSLKNDQYIIPIGGGKDSIVTLQILQKHNKTIRCLLLNPTSAALEVVKAAKAQDPIVITRLLDPNIFKLNNKGYLNGHQPFSAYLAFLFTMCAVLFDYSTIVVSNERSANEGNVDFHGVSVNHQYSKSFDFEKRFKKYRETFLVPSVSYVSFLRPLYELQISKLFAQEASFFQSFKSCNIGRGSNWCNKCPKCMFVYMTVYPFLSKKHIQEIFGTDLFNDEDMLEVVYELIGKREAKPFECVGTYEESLVALYLAGEKHEKEKTQLPLILAHVQKNVLSHEKNMAKRSQSVLHAWNTEHLLPNELEHILKEELQQS